ncbi:MAG: hypothetical protein IPG10_10640 [Flavobacteriales bacterium]|nr:hypothetical protein [Flavobacteriales bacterium]
MNFFTYQEPFEGTSCAGLHTYWQNDQAEYREWMMAPLVEPLVVGQTYYCSFWANAAFGGETTSIHWQQWLANDKVGCASPPWRCHRGLWTPFPAPPNQAHR